LLKLKSHGRQGQNTFEWASCFLVLPCF
jgi:hypothetical protein